MVSKRGYGLIVGLLIVLAIGFVIVSVLGWLIHGHVTYSGNDADYSVQLPLKTCELPLLDMDNVDNAESYKKFADNSNKLIKILNEQSDWFDIPELGDDYSRASRFITEYAPLIKNYNEVILCAQEFNEEKTDENLQEFYIASTRFGYESVTIMGTIFYSASYQTVGTIYRASGLQTLAFKCPSCVSIALSELHWGIRTTLVETSSLIAKKIMETDPGDLDDISIQSLKTQAEKIINSETSENLKKSGGEISKDIAEGVNTTIDFLKKKWGTFINS
jgi:hypothetical protein